MSEWKKEIHEELLALQNRSYRQLKFCRQFYRTCPIGNTLRSQLNWSQYRKLMQIDDPDKREYYELESVNNEGMG